MFKHRGPTAHLGLISCFALILGLGSVSAASAATTIGQLPPGNDPPAFSCDDPLEFLQPTVIAGPGYVVPVNGALLTSWSTKAATLPNQRLKMKVWRKLGDPQTFQVVGHDGPRDLASSVLNTFATDIPVQSGDVIGLFLVNGSGAACTFPSPGESVLFSFSSDFGEGQSTAFSPLPSGDSRLNLTASVALTPSNEFKITKVRKRRRKGSAILTIKLPGPGELSLSGTGIKSLRTGDAVISKEVAMAGRVRVKVKAKGAKKAKLQNTGKVKIKAKVTYTPSGDLPGVPKTKTKPIKLIEAG
jgi:hypothetical protein